MELNPGIRTTINNNYYYYYYYFILCNFISSILRITNSPVADVFVVWAKCADDGKIRGFILEKVPKKTD